MRSVTSRAALVLVLGLPATGLWALSDPRPLDQPAAQPAGPAAEKAKADAPRLTPTAGPGDWQKRVAEMPWEFDRHPQTRAECFHRMARSGQDRPYSIELRDVLGRSTEVLFLRAGQVACRFRAHHGTVFHIARDRLYYARFSPIGSGASVVALDLTTGAQLWETRLRGLGPISHSAYRNQVAMAERDGALIVFGHESRGGYIEALDMGTGRSIGHRTLTSRNPDPVRLSKNTFFLHDWAESPKASLADVEWLVGRFDGTNDTYPNVPCQLTWAPRYGDTLTGVFQELNGRSVFHSEVLTITEVRGSLKLRVRLSNDSIDMRERNGERIPEHVPRKLVKVEPDAVYFNGRTFRKGSGGKIEMFTAADNGDGTIGEGRIVFSPVAGGR